MTVLTNRVAQSSASVPVTNSRPDLGAGTSNCRTAGLTSAPGYSRLTRTRDHGLGGWWQRAVAVGEFGHEIIDLGLIVRLGQAAVGLQSQSLLRHVLLGQVGIEPTPVVDSAAGNNETHGQRRYPDATRSSRVREGCRADIRTVRLPEGLAGGRATAT